MALLRICSIVTSLLLPLLPAQAHAQRASFAWATSVERLGDDWEAIQARLGPPAATDDYGLNHTYRFNGCAVIYNVRNGAIDRIHADVSARCHPAPQGSPVTPQTTFGQLARPGYLFGGSCLDDCPNEHPSVRAEPRLTIGYRRPPPPSIRRPEDMEGFAVFYEADDAGVQAAWRRAIESGAAPAGSVERFYGVSDPPADIVRLLRNVRVRRVSAYRQTHSPSVMPITPR